MKPDLYTTHDQSSARDRAAHDDSTLHARVEEQAHRAIHARNAEIEAAEAARTLWITNPTQTGAGVGSIARHFLFLLLIIACYVLDYSLFSEVAEFLASTVFGGNTVLLGIAKALIPAAIIVVELALCAQRHSHGASDDEAEASGVGWAVLGVFFALVVPSAAVATTIASLGGLTDLVAVAVTVGIAVLAFSVHLLLLFGDLGPSAEAYWVYDSRIRKLKRERRRLGRLAAAAEREAVRCFRYYAAGLQEHARRFGTTPVPPPFDAATNAFLVGMLGKDTIRAFYDGLHLPVALDAPALPDDLAIPTPATLPVVIHARPAARAERPTVRAADIPPIETSAGIARPGRAVHAPTNGVPESNGVPATADLPTRQDMRDMPWEHWSYT